MANLATKTKRPRTKKVKWTQNSQAGFDAYKYLGKVKVRGDAATIQKSLRDEWEKPLH